MGFFSVFFRCLLIAVLPAMLFGKDAVDPGQVSISVARDLEQGHYTREKLDEATSQKFLTTYLTTLDYNKLYFTQQDVDEFEKKYGSTLGDSVLRGDVTPAREIFARFKARVEDRIASNKKAIQKDYKFDSDRTVEIKRQDAPWPKDEAEADQIWQNRIEAELLKERLAEVKLASPAGKETPDAKSPSSGDNPNGKMAHTTGKTPKEIVSHRYDQVLRSVHEMDDEDVVKTFLSSLAQTYDPHSEYMSQSDLENFEITMGLSLVGVGAVLSSEDGYAKVKEIVPGGPADRDGHLKVNDRIAAVAQGTDDFEDVVDMKLDKVVKQIRGKKGTVVRLMVIPADATDPSKRKVVEIVRDEVKLKDSEAKAEMLDLPDAGGRTAKIGWITLPGFYADMDENHPHKSTTEDVAALIGRLKREGMQGLVMDLRQDGGGSLEEAINLTGLFIPKGPVVQAKNANGQISISHDPDSGMAYDGPLIVLVNRLSASASEIFAAALQDYGRAVIVGDERTFGKGTVQTILKLGQPMPFFSLGGMDSEVVKAGALKLTIQKFYRVKGGSTQLKGVESDVVLPSQTDNPEFGESSLKNCLTYDEVAPVKIPEVSTPLCIAELKSRSAQRVAADPEFGYIKEDIARFKDMIAKNALSLNEKERRGELADEKKRKETRDAERLARGPALNVQAYDLPLDDVALPKLRPVAFDRLPKGDAMTDDDEADSKKSDQPHPDPIRNETIRIMEDYIDLSKQARTASVQTAKAP